jgi:glycosyltransferase involved in cell wall biosynthesis
MTDQHHGDISVVIPVKDRKDSLLRALRSVKNQNYPVKEIVIVDDGSAEPMRIISEETFGNVIYLRNEISMGAPHARNRGWRTASAQYIAFLDSDDELLPSCLGNKIHKLIKEDLDLTVGSFIIEQNGVQKPFRFKVDRNIPLRDNLLMNSPFDARTSTFVVKRSVLQQISFDEQLKKHQDWDLFINIDEQYKTGFTNDCDVILHVSATDRISTNLKHESTKYFIEKNKNKVSADAMFLFQLKMMYKSFIRNDKDGMQYYRRLLVTRSNGLSVKYSLLAVLIRLNILNVSFLHFLKRIF